MRVNPLIAKIKSGETGFNGWLTLGSVAVAEAMAHQPWDCITIDMQHGLSDFETTVNMLRAISTTAVTPMVRVPWLEPGIIMRVLDAGAFGVICPMINTTEQCREFVSYCRYAPMGSRSFGPTRAPLYGGADYWKGANENVLAIAMIETAQALENLDGILSIEGLSGVYIGPADLSLSMGFDPVQDQSHPQVLGVIEDIRIRAVQAGKFAIMHCGPVDYAAFMLDKKFPLLTVSNDSRLLATAQQQLFDQLKRARASAGESKSSTY